MEKRLLIGVFVKASKPFKIELEHNWTNGSIFYFHLMPRCEEQVIEQEKDSTRHSTLSVLLHTDKFIVHQPFDTGLNGSFIGLFI